MKNARQPQRAEHLPHLFEGALSRDRLVDRLVGAIFWRHVLDADSIRLAGRSCRVRRYG